MTVDEWHECDEFLHHEPRLIEALARRGITDLSLVLVDTWAYGAALVPEPLPRPADRLGRRLGAGHARRQPLRPSRGQPASDHRPQRDDPAGHRGRRPGPARGHTGAADPGRVPAGPGRWAAARGRAVGHRPARGPVVHARGQPAPLAELGDAGRLQLPRGDGPAHRRLPRRRPAAAGGAPAVLRRDGGALSRPVPGPLPAYGVRHRRVGPGLHDHLADPGLRLPRRDPLSRRRAARLARRAGDDPQRDLHPRGGQRDPVEARRSGVRHRGPPDAPAGPVLPRDRGQLRVPRLLALLPGRQHRVRGPRHGDHGDQPVRAGRGGDPRHGRGPLDLRAVPPALHRRAT